jgi:tryptophan 2,3-dioxygenase
MEKIKQPINYSDYLKLDKILSSQLPESEKYGKIAHDEVLFIIIHQVYELWFKQILHELDSIITMFKNEFIDEENIGITVSRLGRIIEIQKILIDQIKILETMTPLDFLDFRDLLTPASGFQSFQFRLIEVKLGLTQNQRLEYNRQAYYTRLPKEQQEIILQNEKETSLFDLVAKWLERTPFLEIEGFNFLENYKKIVGEMLKSDREIIKNNPILSDEERKIQLQMMDQTEKHFLSLFDVEEYNKLIKNGSRRLSYKATLSALFINLYRDQPILHTPYKLLSSLVDIDELFTLWRYRHSLMVLRMIGRKIGTGGSSGYAYLRATADKHKVFSDLFEISTLLIPRSKLPELPEKLKIDLGFYYTQRINKNGNKSKK